MQIKFKSNLSFLLTTVLVLAFFVITKPSTAHAFNPILFDIVQGSSTGTCDPITSPCQYNISNTTLGSGESFTWSAAVSWKQWNGSSWVASTYTNWVTLAPTSGTCSPGSCSSLIPTLNSSVSSLPVTGSHYFAAAYTITCSAGTMNCPPPTLFVEANVTPPCVINSFAPATTPINYLTAVNMNWSTSNCTSVTIVGGNWAAPTGVGLNGPQSTGNLTNGTTLDKTYSFTLSATGSNGSSDTKTATVVVHAPCIGTISANPTHVGNNQTSTLTFSTTGLCSSQNISSSLGVGTLFNPAKSEPSSGTDTTDPITQTTVYTYNVNGPNNTQSSLATVARNDCVINVTSKYNGVQQNPPGGFTYTITGPQGPLVGNNQTGNNPWSVNVTGAMWTMNYNTSPGTAFVGYGTAQAQACNTQGGYVTFELDFVDQVVTGSGAAYNTLANAGAPCDGILLQWTNGQYADKNYIQRNGVDISGSPFPSSTVTYTDTGLDSHQSYTYRIKAANSVTGVQGAWVNFSPASISPTECTVDFSTSDKIITAVNNNGINYT